MKKTETLPKFKGLKNGKDWESGNLKLENDLALIFRGNHQFYVFKDSVSKFTGFINASGEEIYDGDLLTSKDNNQGDRVAKRVFWDEDHQQWKVGFSPIEDPLISHPLRLCLDQVVVGHIFTHQHLLASPKGDFFRTSNEANL